MRRDQQENPTVSTLSDKGQVSPVAQAGASVRLRTVTFHPAKGCPGRSPVRLRTVTFHPAKGDFSPKVDMVSAHRS
jgi:hypothetical protein